MQDCVVRNMTGDGIHFASNFISHLSVTNTFVGHNVGNGILVQPVGSASVTAVFERVRAQYNTGANSWGIALNANATAGTITGTATDTVSSDNTGGFLADGSSANLIVVRSVVANNEVGLSGLNGLVALTQNTINNNVVPCAGSTITYADNNVLNSNNTSCGNSPNSKE
jgi:hypothetical protein